MSVKIQGGGNAPPATPEAGKPAAPQGGAQGATQGALGLGVDVGVIADAPVGEAYEARVEKPRDGYEPKRSEGAPREKSAQESGGAESPFRSFAKRQDQRLPPRELGRAVDIDVELDADVEVLSKLTDAEVKAGPDKSEKFDKVRQGNLLLTSDAQGARDKKVPLDGKKLESFAAKLLGRSAEAAKQDAKSFAKQYARFLAGGKANVQAFVQRVLRESYAIQNELLMDHAEKVKFHNAQKKKVREQLKKAREVGASWAGLAKGQEHWVSDTPFDALELGEDGEWFQPAMTEQDVAAWQARSKKEEAAGPASAMDLSSFFADDTGLTDGQWEGMGELARIRVGGTFNDLESDDFIVDNFDDLAAIIPLLTHRDIEGGVLDVIIGHLSAGDAEEEELLRLFDVATPPQMLQLIARGHDGEDFGFDSQETSEFMLSTRNKLREVYSELGLGELDFQGPITPQRAGAILTRLRDHCAQSDSNTSSAVDYTGPKLGEPRAIRAMPDLDAYIKTLEERLNSIGDDGQLANVDMQNALQKQQQTLQMMSNMAKMLHDTAMAIVRKVSG